MINENRFYVYSHRLVKDDSVICIGSGTGYRIRSQQRRNKQWNELVKKEAWYFTVLKEGLTKRESEELEIELISIYNPVGNTRKCTLEARRLCVEYINNSFYYDETSPSGLRYKIHNRQRGTKERNTGDVAGFCVKGHSDSRYSVKVNGKGVLTHRIVWYLCRGEDPVGFVVDHKDGNHLNNKICNLQKVTTMQNNRNCALRKDNLSGYKGVRLHSKGHYIASWYISLNKNSHKSFSCSKYGKDLALALALEYRHRMVSERAEQGAALSERHTGTYTRHPALEEMDESTILEMFSCKSNTKKWFN